MTITTDTTPAEVLAAIEAATGPITNHRTRDIIEGFVNDGLNAEFIEDAGIETLAQHLADVLERIEAVQADCKAQARTGFTINTSTGKRTEGNAEAREYAAALRPAARIVRDALSR